ncbi:tripartite tricarboxylate transporter substrate-binding protein, partial [Bradyrhizobium sp. NBAIM08]|uniref:tripartite tricarboxylate transporter substrate-binding protein n=1 Tax=Bradyrhizobium sp. NBAIM08 TaxID=2793815 RepID=UPI00201C5E75
PKMQYDPVKAFAPVTLIATTPMILVTHPSLRLKNLKDFLAYAAARPGKLNYASGGIGTPQQFAGELLKMSAKLDMNHVPYKSGGLQVVGIVGGEVLCGFAALLPALPHVKSGRLDGIAVSSIKRSSSMPEI